MVDDDDDDDDDSTRFVYLMMMKIRQTRRGVNVGLSEW